MRGNIVYYKYDMFNVMQVQRNTSLQLQQSWIRWCHWAFHPIGMEEDDPCWCWHCLFSA